MPGLQIHLQGEGCWPDIDELEAAGKFQQTVLTSIAFLEGGMQSGKPSVAVRMTLADGTVVVAETSLALMQAALRSFDQYLIGKAERGEQ